MQDNNNALMYENSGEMTLNGSHNRFENVQHTFLQMNNDLNAGTNLNLSHENTQLTTTTTISNTNLNQLPTNKLLFCYWYLDQLRNKVDNVVTRLFRQNFSQDEYKHFVQTCHENSQFLFSQEGFHIFSSILQNTQLKPQTIDQDLPMGVESHETSDEFPSAPLDENQDHTNAQIDNLVNIPVPHILKGASLSTSPLDLSQLLLQPLEISQGELLINLNIIHQPKPFWRARTIKEFYPLQSATERQGIVVQLSNLKNDVKNELYVHIQLLTHDGKVHPSKSIALPKPIVPGTNEQNLDIKPKYRSEYGWNKITKTILYRLTKIQCPEDPNQIKLLVHMFNSSKKINVKTPNDAFQNFINDELVNKIFKLRIQICRLTNDRRLEYASQYIDTILIKESKGTEELKPLDLSNLRPCGCGKKNIEVLLNTPSEKQGFDIWINREQLPMHKFTINKKTIELYPPVKTSGANGFDLFIAKIDVRKRILRNENPYEYVYFNDEILFNGGIAYANINNCNHVEKKRTKKKLKPC